MAVITTASTFGLVVGAAYADPGPTNVTPPSIAGVAQQGVPLTVDPGTWSGDPITFTYLWSDGTTETTDVPSAADVGQDVSVIVTATNDAGTLSQTVTTGPVLPAAPVLDAAGPAPTITGTAQQGDTLSVSSGNWDNDPTGFNYVWEDCDSTGTVCNAISGALSSSTYTVQSTDVGSTIEVVVTASNAGGDNQATSGPDGPVLPAAPVSQTSGPPTITGTAQQGDALTVTSNGTWSNSPTGFTYVWEDCASGSCAPISGAASSPTYTVQSTDVGSTVEVIVTASNAGGQNSATSNSTRTVLPAAPAVTGAPGIGGTPQQGDTLTASNGSWNNNPAKFTYAWEDCDSSGSNCATISGASSVTYTLKASDVGKLVSVTVTASNLGGATPVMSAPVGPVLPPAPANTTAPQINGTPEQGDTLAVVSNGAWSNATT